MPDGRSLTRLINDLATAGQFETATTFAERFVSESPEDHRAWCSLSWVTLSVGDNHRALLAAERAISLAPETEWALRTYARIMHYGFSRDATALSLARRAVAAAPRFPMPWALVAVCANTLGYDHEADDASSRSMAANPESHEALNARAFVLRRADRKGAIDLCLSWLAREPTSTHAMGNLALSYLADLRFDDARDAALRYLAVKPNDHSARLCHAHATAGADGVDASRELFQATYEQTIREAEHESERFPERYVPHRRRGLALRRLGRHREALDALEVALARPGATEDAGLRRSLAYTHAGLEQWDEALAAAEEASALDADSPFLLLPLAELSFLSGRPDGVRSAFATMLERAEGSHQVGSAGALVAMARGDFDGALRGLDEARARWALNSCRTCAEAICHARLGAVDRATRLLEEADAHQPFCECEWKKTARAAVTLASTPPR